MNSLSEILVPIRDYVEEFERTFPQLFRAHSEVLSRALAHLQHHTGKHFRPVLLGLCAQATGGHTSELTLVSASVIELLHSASLVHDDVIDWSDMRRGQPTLNAIYSNHQAVLIGDYILSTAFLEMVQRCDNPVMLQTVAWAGRMLSEGELMQISNAYEQHYTEEYYLQVIDRKTGSLFEACGLLGAMSVKASAEHQEYCQQFGRIMGRIFQMTDDLFDYDSTLDLGKPAGHDLIEGKVTLPLLYVLEQASPQERKQWIEKLQQPLLPDQKEYFITLAKERGGIDYTRMRIDTLLLEGETLLEGLPASSARDSLLALLRLSAYRTR